MSLGQLRAVLAPSLASLLLILCVCAIVVRRPESSGIPLHVYPLHPEGAVHYECNSLSIVLFLSSDGVIRIHRTEVVPADLTPKLSEIFEYRAVRRAYVVADSDVSYARFADFLSRIEDVKAALDVVLLSGDLRREADHELTFQGLCGYPPSILRSSYKPIQVLRGTFAK